MLQRWKAVGNRPTAFHLIGLRIEPETSLLERNAFPFFVVILKFASHPTVAERHFNKNNYSYLRFLLLRPKNVKYPTPAKTSGCMNSNGCGSTFGEIKTK